MTGQAQGVLVLLLVIGVSMDIRTGKIKNELIVIGLFLAVICRWFNWNEISLCSGLFGAIIPVMSLFWLFLFHMLGAGDIKLFCLTGSFIGENKVWICMLAAFLTGGILSLYKMLRYKSFKERFLYLSHYISAMSSECEIIPYFKEGDSKDCVIHFSIPILIGTCITMGVYR